MDNAKIVIGNVETIATDLALTIVPVPHQQEEGVQLATNVFLLQVHPIKDRLLIVETVIGNVLQDTVLDQEMPIV